MQRPQVRLVTLTGPGGTGKTRLARQVARRLSDQFADGVFFVSLAAVAEAKLVPSTIASVLGVKERERQSLTETVQEYLQDKQLLLILDNFEHLLAATPLVANLLPPCPQLSLLVTSRFLLHLSREHEYPVPALSIPDAGHLPPLGALSRYEGVALFLQQAEAARPSFTLTTENATSVAQICLRLDGLPLAIELAAARIRVFSPQALLGRLSHRLQVLRGGAVDSPLRQQTLRATIDWSYDLLNGAEQVLLARLSVFAGGCTLAAVGAVCAAGSDLPIDALDGITGLIEKSLLGQVEGANSEPRFFMLETLREYAAEKLASSGEERPTREAHAQYFLGVAREAVLARREPEFGVCLERLESELDNMRTAFGWLRDHGEPSLGLEFTTALDGFWIGRGHVTEGVEWFKTFLGMHVPNITSCA